MFVRNSWEFIPPPVQTRMEKWHILAFERFGFIHDLGGGRLGFAVSFFVILSKTVAPWGRLPIIRRSFGLK